MNKTWLFVAVVALALIVGRLVAYRQLGPGSIGAGSGPGLLYFYADWWEVCKRMEPIVNGLEKKYSPIGQFKIERVNIDTAAGKKLARQYGIIGQPTIILFDQSGQEVGRLIGEYTAERLRQEIEQILAE